MSLTPDDIEYIKTHMAEWLAEQSLGRPVAVYEVELRERMVRVEEALRHQQELMRAGFAQTEERLQQIDRRFELIDNRFQQVDGRFDQMLRRHDRQFLWLVGFIATVGGLVIATSQLG